MSKVLIEVCCGSADDVIQARLAGADRVELNSDLFHGGLTPTIGALRVARRETGLPVMTMIRPREGGFCYTEAEFAVCLEDERDLDKVRLNLAMYRRFVEGFIPACGMLTKREIETLPLGAKLMTLECGLRFLTDYLDGDRYFAVAHPEHNLDRARTQFKLVADTERRWEEIQAIVRPFLS